MMSREVILFSDDANAISQRENETLIRRFSQKKSITSRMNDWNKRIEKPVAISFAKKFSFWLIMKKMGKEKENGRTKEIPRVVQS